MKWTTGNLYADLAYKLINNNGGAIPDEYIIFEYSKEYHLDFDHLYSMVKYFANEPDSAIKLTPINKLATDFIDEGFNPFNETQIIDYAVSCGVDPTDLNTAVNKLLDRKSLKRPFKN